MDLFLSLALMPVSMLDSYEGIWPRLFQAVPLLNFPEVSMTPPSDSII